MKSKLSLLIAIILSIASIFLAFAAFMISRSAKDTAMYVSKGDNSSPNEPLVVDRIESEAERTRMEKYVADLQASKRVVKTLQGLSGETIDCVDIFAQPALKRRGMEGHQVQLAPSSQPPTEAKPEAVQHESRIPAPDQLYSITGEICGERTAPMTRLTMDTLTLPQPRRVLPEKI
jgi:hypothetical protein